MSFIGRCARAGRSGKAYSLVVPDEHPYLLDLHLFLGKPLQLSNNEVRNIGRISRSLLEEQHSTLLMLHNNYADLVCNFFIYNPFKIMLQLLFIGKHEKSNRECL